MLDSLKQSNEPEHLIAAATRYLKGLKGNLVQIKKQKMAKEHAAREEAAAAAFQQFQQQQSYGGQQQQQPSYSHMPTFKQPPGMPNMGPGYHSTSGWM